MQIYGKHTNKMFGSFFSNIQGTLLKGDVDLAMDFQNTNMPGMEMTGEVKSAQEEITKEITADRAENASQTEEKADTAEVTVAEEHKHTHKALDRPVLSYFLLYIHSNGVLFIVALMVAIFFESLIGDYAFWIGDIISAFIVLLIHKRNFPEFRGCLRKEGFISGMRFQIVFLSVLLLYNLIFVFLDGFANPFKALIMALAPGVSEEVMFRGPGISNFMRTQRSEEKIPVIFWLSALAFGFVHVGNILAGANAAGTIIQVLYCIGHGALLGAVYLRTGNLWPSIVAHTLVDFTAFLDIDCCELGGLVTSGISVWDTITVGLSVLMFFFSLKMIGKEHRQEILAVWDERFSR